MVRYLEIKTNDTELQQTLPLTTEQGETLTMNHLQTMIASLLPDQEFSLRYTDSDGDHVTITNDTDVKELEKFMQDEQLQSLEVLVVPRETRTHQCTSSVAQMQLRGLVTAISELTAKPDTSPTLASVMNLLVASLQAMDVADNAEELQTVKMELLLLLQDDAFRSAVEELSAIEEFKELADAMVAAVYDDDAHTVEDVATARLDEVFMFAQHVVARCPSLNPVVVNVVKSLMTGLVRYNDKNMDGDASDKWTESHGPFAKIEEPAMVRAFKFTCRCGGKFGRRHGHGHYGKFGRHHSKLGRRSGCHGKVGRHHYGQHCSFEHDDRHNGGRNKFGRHGHHHGDHHGAPGFAFYGHHPDHRGHLVAPRYGFPFNDGSHLELQGHGRPNFHGPPPEFDDRR